VLFLNNKFMCTSQTGMYIDPKKANAGFIRHRAHSNPTSRMPVLTVDAKNADKGDIILIVLRSSVISLFRPDQQEESKEDAGR